MRIEEINTVLHIQAGAPVPVVLSDEYHLGSVSDYQVFQKQWKIERLQEAILISCNFLR